MKAEQLAEIFRAHGGVLKSCGDEELFRQRLRGHAIQQRAPVADEELRSSCDRCKQHECAEQSLWFLVDPLCRFAQSGAMAHRYHPIVWISAGGANDADFNHSLEAICSANVFSIAS